MTDQEDTKKDIDYYLDRRKKEDGLFNTRTTLILITNSIAAVAVGQKSATIKIIVSLSMICINILWIKCSFEAVRFIGLLTGKIQEGTPLLPDEELWRDKIYNKRLIRLGPLDIIGKAIPVILLIAWSFGLAISIYKDVLSCICEIVQ